MSILDVVMPLMSGIKKAKLLKRRPKSAHSPIVLMSAKEEPEPESLSEVAGTNGYLVKPFGAEQLVGKVNELLPDAHPVVQATRL
jgi:twitching motility two-component system response regulator PilH